MKLGRAKSTVRLTPVEFTGLVQDKYQLAERIAQHRTRLLSSFPIKSIESELGRKFSDGDVCPRSHTMQYLSQQHAAVPLMFRAALAATVFTVLARKLGHKKLWRWAGVVVPIVWPWLKRK